MTMAVSESASHHTFQSDKAMIKPDILACLRAWVLEIKIGPDTLNVSSAPASSIIRRWAKAFSAGVSQLEEESGKSGSM